MNFETWLGGQRFRAFADRLIERTICARHADFVIGGLDRPYIYRWWLTPWSRAYRGVHDEQRTLWQRFVTRLPGAYLHLIVRSDDDRALHDHPWANVSLLLRGTYVEHTIAAGGIHHRKRVRAGDVVVRAAKSAHRLEIDDGDCWSLFLMGFRTRHWGFHCQDAGWIPWREFTNPADNGASIGKGCGA